MVELIPVSESELAVLIRESDGRHLHLAFGTGGAALEWNTKEGIPWYITRIGMMRGVLNENCAGAGI
jgi:hypothetical protein